MAVLHVGVQLVLIQLWAFLPAQQLLPHHLSAWTRLLRQATVCHQQREMGGLPGLSWPRYHHQLEHQQQLGHQQQLRHQQQLGYQQQLGHHQQQQLQQEGEEAVCAPREFVYVVRLTGRCEAAGEAGGTAEASLTASLHREEHPDKDWNKNFASPECGAKLVLVSPHIKNPGHVISKNNDEYMLLECSRTGWFVVELCETIRISRFEVDNLELYSGSAKRISFSVADKSKSKVWTNFGNFSASGTKHTTEVFESESSANVFGKFVKVEILENYADEHFCTLTSFRVFGISEYEFLLDDHDSPEPGHQSRHVEEGEQEVAVAGGQSQVEGKMQKVMVWQETVSQHNQVCSTVFSLYQFYSQHVTDNMCTSGPQPDTAAIVTTKNSNQQKELNSTEVGERGNVGVKETLLVQLSSRVKMLERNSTQKIGQIKQLNRTAIKQSEDLEKILDVVIRAKDSFRSSLKEQMTVRERLRELLERVDTFEQLVEKNSERNSTIHRVVIVILVIGFCLVCILFLTKANRGTAPIVGPSSSHCKLETREAATMTEQVTVIAPTAKKVVFDLEDQLQKTSRTAAGRSAKINRRRVTWCGGGGNHEPQTPSGTENHVVAGGGGLGGGGIGIVTQVELAPKSDKNLGNNELIKSILKKGEEEGMEQQQQQQQREVQDDLTLLQLLGRQDRPGAHGRRVTWCGGQLAAVRQLAAARHQLPIKTNRILAV